MTNQEQIAKELKEVAPLLAQIKKPEQPQAPDDYFRTFPATLMKRIRSEEVAAELSVVAPALLQIEKPSPQQIPGYFESFPALMMQRIRDNQPKTSTPHPVIVAVNVFVEKIAAAVFQPRYAAAFAGFATIVVVAGMLLIHIGNECRDIDCRMAQLSTEDINYYMATHADEFGSDLLDFSTDDKRLLKNYQNIEASMQRLAESDEGDNWDDLLFE